jgi:SAM-dependent methyltransferase
MFQFNFDEAGHSSAANAESGLAMPWQSKRQKVAENTTPEDARAASIEAYRKLSWDEKWARSANLPTPSEELLVQYLWHFDMINDVPRNQEYHRAIVQAVAATRQQKGNGAEVSVLDVGTGSGLLALLSAKSGATKVTAIEMEAAVARTASMNVARNKLQDVVKVEVGESTSRDSFATSRVPGQVDIVVAELLDTGLLGESFIRVLRDAKARGWMAEADGGSQPAARVIPCRARVWGQLVESTVRITCDCSQCVLLATLQRPSTHSPSNALPTAVHAADGAVRLIPWGIRVCTAL